MSIKIAINGFGRIGRLAFRQMLDDDAFEITAINDLTSTKMLSYLLKYDTTQGTYDKKIEYHDDAIIVNGGRFRVLAERDPKNLPWGSLGIDVVLECTGHFTSKAKASAHAEAGAGHVVISAPAGDDLPTVVFGVNENTLSASDTVISCASCTTNCLAPMANALNNLLPIKKGYMTTIHAYTHEQNIVDAPHTRGNLRRARAAAMNIAPTTTGAAKAIGLVIPSLSGKLDGSSLRVPVCAGSIVELFAIVEGRITADEINAAMKRASSESFGYTDDEIVSSDVIGMRYGSLFDATLTKVMEAGDETLVKVSSWYDNENSFVSQMTRTIRYMAKLR